MKKKALFALLAAVVVAAMAAPATATTQSGVEKVDILGQGGNGVLAENGAKLARNDNRIKVWYRAATPDPGSYIYPTADMVPPGAVHPEVVPGYPEVFTLWAFVFNNPELCSGPCDFDDIGDTPAQGGVYQLGGKVATEAKIGFKKKVSVGDAPVVGAVLQNPRGAEVHVAMAPHGKAYCGEELMQQLTGSVGTPAHWWPALFFPDDVS